ncbi:MFS transporter [Nocardioides alkalitolerans]|uniref:MFS transporter n=1 Tax=Nocardioides alkalitolerans TaxID=281714 RepID=UPI000421F4DE|nr:MFS transporter [Nocardioides alkalitolerans]
MSTAPPVAARPLLHDRDLLLFAAARVVAVAGSAVTGVAMPLLVLQLSGSAFVAALVAAAQVAPYLVLGLLAGAMADRWPRRRVMLAAQLTSAAALLSVPLAQAAGALTSTHALVVALVVASAFVWFDAAAFGALPAIVGRERIVAANSLVWTSTTLVGIGAPALGGLLVAWLGSASALAVDAAAYVAAAALLLVVTAPMGPLAVGRDGAGPSPRPTLRADVAEGLRFVLRQPVVRDLTLVGVGNSVAGGAVTALLVVLAVDGAGTGAVGEGQRYGVMLAVVAVGGFLAASALPWLARRVPTGWLTLGGLALGVPAVAGLAGSAPYPVVLVLLLAWSGAHTLVVLNGIATRQRVTPDPLQARVNTTARMIAWGGTPFGAVLGGAAAETVGVGAAMAGAAVVLALSVVAGAGTGLRHRAFGAE